MTIFKNVISHVLLILGSISLTLILAELMAGIVEKKYIPAMEVGPGMASYFQGRQYLMLNKKNGLFYDEAGKLIRRYYYGSKGKGPIKVAIIGDSFSIGSGVSNPEEESYVAYLSQKIPKEFKILCFGDGGFNAFQKLVVLKEMALDYNPDIVILQFCPNDDEPNMHIMYQGGGRTIFIRTGCNFLLSEDNSKILFSFPCINDKQNRFLLRSAFMRCVSYLYNNLSRSPSDINIKKCIDSIREMSSVLQKKGIPFLIINFPLAINDEHIDACSSPTLDELSALTKELGLHYINLCHHLNLTDVKSHLDDYHYNKDGYFQVAKILSKIIVENVPVEEKSEDIISVSGQ